jgi:hypothetical protein
MADDINLNGPYNTKVPSYSETADIQQALKLFLYGSLTLPANQSEISSSSIAGHLKYLQNQLDILNSEGIGSSISNTRPTGVVSGHIWVDATSSVTSTPLYSAATYRSYAPNSPTTGTLWVDSDSSPLAIYVWSGTAWRKIGL